MSKRRANVELNHENWDVEDDEKEEPGTFRTVNEEELKKRVIRKAKRSNTGNSSGNSPFSGSSPFAAFSGFSAASTPFSFSKKTEKVNSGLSVLNSDSQDSCKTKNGQSSDVTPSQSEITTSNNGGTKSSRSIEYYRQLQSLNESILKWMQLHLAKNACCDFTPVFNDYKKHMDSLNVTYPIQRKNELVEKLGVSPNSNSSQDSQSKEMEFTYSSAKPSGFKFENLNKDETDYGANFTARTTNTSTFSFGIRSTPTATSTGTKAGPNSSSKEEEKPEPEPFKFTMGNSSSKETGFSSGFSFASAIATKKAEPAAADEENYEPPKNDFVAVAEEDAIYSKKCKLFFKKDDAYADKGVGMLYLKSLEGKTQLLVRADTNLGNILLNIRLSSSLPMSRTGKNNVLLVCVPNPPIDSKTADSKEAIPMLIRVKTAEDADELLEQLNKHKS